MSGRVWLVTGSSRGLGRRIVEAAAAAGDRVLATARRPSSLDGLAGERVAVAALDVTDPAAARHAVDTAVDRFGRLDVVVNNAGQADLGAVEDTPEESFWRQHSVAYSGVVHVTRAALPVFRGQGSGHFIQISSLGARMGTPGLAAYQAAKAAATVCSLSLAAEIAPLGLHVTVVEPGNLRTDMLNSDSMTILPVSPPYRPTVGAAAERLATLDGAQPGDPAKAAAAIVSIAHMDDPPLRLPLGTDAVELAATAARRLAAEDARWHDLSTSIDYAAGRPERPR